MCLNDQRRARTVAVIPTQFESESESTEISLLLFAVNK